MVRILAAATLIGLLSAGAAFAEMKDNSSTAPAVATSNVATSNGDSKTTAATVVGAKGFTESEARSRIESRGYTDIFGLKKDDQGTWRGKATKNGTQVDVAIDGQGNDALSYEDIKPATK
jgi:hypothetical protein